MENLNNEQIENTAQTAVAEEVTGEKDNKISLSKFKDVESLQRAYSFLESEFTKRSQRLKRLEEENRELSLSLETNNSLSENEEADNGEDFFKEYPEAKRFEKELMELLVNSSESENTPKNLRLG